MPRSSSTGAGVIRDEPERIEAALLDFVASLKRRHAEVARVIWFGSRVHGVPTRSSDVDLCIVLRSSDEPFLDRIPQFLPRAFPCAVDVFPYTEEEFAALERERPGWYREIVRGRDL